MNLGLVVAIQQVDPVDLQFFLHVVDKGFPYPGHVKGFDKVFDRVVPIAVLKCDVRQMIGAIAKHGRENMFRRSDGISVEGPGQERHKRHQAHRADDHGYPERLGQTADFYRLRFALGLLKRRRTMPDRLVSHLLIRSLSCIPAGIT